MKMKRAGLVLGTLAVGLIATACGAQSRVPEIVEVSLTEFQILAPETEFESGKTYRFVITNNGALNHEFTVMPAMAEAPMQMDGQDMYHDMTGAMLHVAEEKLTPGATFTVDYVFPAEAASGELEFACHLAGHYEAGMFTPITVGS